MENIIIFVKNGVVAHVDGLPEGWTYEIKDLNKDNDDDAEQGDYTTKQNSSSSNKSMNYMQQFEAELRDQLAVLVLDLEELEEKELNVFIKWAKAKHLASYRNGVEVGRKDSPNSKRGNYKNKSK